MAFPPNVLTDPEGELQEVAAHHLLFARSSIQYLRKMKRAASADTLVPEARRIRLDMGSEVLECLS